MEVDSLYKTFSFKSFSTSRNWLIAPKTHLVDSFTPFVEEIFLPKVATEAGRVSFELKFQGELPAFNNNSRKERFSQLFKQRRVIDRTKDESVFIDLRQHYPDNLAHAITIHLPIALCARAFLLNQNSKQLVLVFPESLPKHIQQLFIELGFDFILENAKIYGDICSYKLDSLICIRGGLPDVMKLGVDIEFKAKLVNLSSDLPKKIFISRKDSRKLKNELEVENFLIKLGFVKIYMEDFPVIKQLALVALADEIVAIHGAALGPMIFRSIFDFPEVKLVEIFSPAHMSNVYRIITEQLGGVWVGVRGKLWPRLITLAYDCIPDKVRQYSLNEFEVCLESLQKGLDILARNGKND